ncbi:hypothetical protein BC830DRAFT_504842 [Chytriomyces sp. MP71]|nr:hypothetical protein BC830DRAFT_504842 [Chytriomyces sp. MP71]
MCSARLPSLHSLRVPQPDSLAPLQWPSPPLPPLATHRLAMHSLVSSNAATPVLGAGGVNLLESPVLTATPSLSSSRSPIPDYCLPEPLHLDQRLPKRASVVMPLSPPLYTHIVPLPSSPQLDDFDPTFEVIPVISRNARRQVTYTCPFSACDKSFLKHSAFRSHYTEHSGSKNHACESCPSRFTRRHDYLRHVKSVHGAGAHAPVCKYCSKAFSRIDSLKRHERRCAQ